jgi:hypothetical protein
MLTPKLINKTQANPGWPPIKAAYATLTCKPQTIQDHL